MLKNYVFIILFFGTNSLFGLSPKAPSSNMGPTWINSTNVTTIESNFNAARRAEENDFATIASNALGDLSLPSQATWDGMTPSEKGLHILNAERTCRAGLNYGDGAVLGLPLEGIELHMQDISEYYANLLMDTGLYSHNADGFEPKDRIDNDCIIGLAANVYPSLDCHETLARSENLARFINWAAGADGELISRSLYLWIYQDDDANHIWGHRAACLIQDVDPYNGNSGYGNNHGPAGSEGFVSFAIADGELFGWATHSHMVVMNVFDPTPNGTADCDYQIIGTTNSYTAPTNIMTSTGNYSANRTRVERIGGEDWTHYLDDNGTPTNDVDDVVLLSLRQNNQYIGSLCKAGFDVNLGVNANNPITRIMPATAPYVTTGFDVLSRYWEVTPLKEPEDSVEVKYYYTNTELTAILNVSLSATVPADLTWFKFKTASNIDPDPQNGHTGAITDDFVKFSNPTFGSYGSELFAMYMVKGFSGGGGGTSQGPGEDPIGPPPLAVELIYFNGQETRKGNKLSWATAQEYNSSHFILERSIDGIDYKPLAIINSKQNTSSQTQYQHLDKDFDSITNYYRLWEVDLSGLKTNQGITVIKNKDISNTITLSPNPVVDFVVIDTESKSNAEYVIFTADAKVVQQGFWVKGEKLDLSQLPTGQYYIKMIFDNAESLNLISKL